MRFDLDDDQRALADTVDSLVARRGDLRAAIEAGYDTALWRTLCDQIGVAGLAIPEEYGGAGCTYVESHVVLERLGATLTPSPLLGSAVLTAQAVLAAAPPADRERLLPDLAAGRSLGALAWADAAGRWRADGSDVTARPTGSGWTLTGTATLVLDGADADLLLVVAGTRTGVGLFEVSPDATGVTRDVTPALDPTLRFATLTFRGARASALSTDAAPALRRVRDVAAIAVTALQVGAAQRCLDLTVAHLRDRVQFGRPLGSFQALKHRVADLFVEVETARSMSWAAAWAAAHDPDDLPLRAALAKAWCSDAFTHVAAETIQLHGGIAITWEHDAHLYFKRAHATAQLFGAAREHRRRLLEYV
ncbi:acyl-CoA dehydrogenase family protein [Cryptosporangium aurantiacum]|uniref:Acyl-CoA dehydrogenase n=1 Tax=Cryptosporangium aurantiacum TaxID=134849 RepID=A0A1M7RBZ3_9ACTN|nr:acyl-CoA dehydrogenase family protein [Cryptosporangium aurantiacum]SHN43690.1 Acyl-CoA dehydrogenase [Cryptosporangium aurantiacum]